MQTLHRRQYSNGRLLGPEACVHSFARRQHCIAPPSGRIPLLRQQLLLYYAHLLICSTIIFGQWSPWQRRRGGQWRQTRWAKIPSFAARTGAVISFSRRRLMNDITNVLSGQPSRICRQQWHRAYIPLRRYRFRHARQADRFGASAASTFCAAAHHVTRWRTGARVQGVPPPRYGHVWWSGGNGVATSTRIRTKIGG